MKRSVPRLHGLAKKVAKGELIGLAAEVVGANDEGILGLRGTIVDETLHTLSLRDRDGRTRRLSKAGTTWRFTIDGETVDIDGRAMEFRPEDRTKKVR